MCAKHYKGWWKHDDPVAAFKAPNGAGCTKRGYRYVTVSGQAVLEHRHIMEQYLGRKLHSDENVHHINGQRGDNRIENLELWSSSQPAGQRVGDKVRWAREILRRYGDTCPE